MHNLFVLGRTQLLMEDKIVNVVPPLANGTLEHLVPKYKRLPFSHAIRIKEESLLAFLALEVISSCSR